MTTYESVDEVLLRRFELLLQFGDALERSRMRLLELCQFGVLRELLRLLGIG